MESISIWRTRSVPVAMRFPSPLAGLGIPYLVGPVGGSLATSPAGFESDGDTAPWYVALRQIDKLRIRFDPLLRATLTEAACVVGIAPYVGSFLEDLSIRRLEVLSETGIETLPDPVDRADRDGPVGCCMLVGSSGQRGSETLSGQSPD